MKYDVEVESRKEDDVRECFHEAEEELRLSGSQELIATVDDEEVAMRI